MAYHKNTVDLEKMLLKFLGEPDPMLSMLEWLCHKMMEVEVENKLNAGKGEHPRIEPVIAPEHGSGASIPGWEQFIC